MANAPLHSVLWHGGRLAAYDIGLDGALSGHRIWAALGESAAPDGICIDASGAVWYADVPNRCCVRVREGGEVLETIELDRGGFSCALSDADPPTLYVTAADYANLGDRTGRLYAVDVNVPGIR